MSAHTIMLSAEDIVGLISSEIYHRLPEDDLVRLEKFAKSSVVWAGYHQDKLKALWGLMAPTLMSDSAYLWLHLVEPITDCEFIFVRRSRIAIEKALTHFPTIIGHCERYDRRAQRWLTWLGATFGPPDLHGLPFTIKAPDGSVTTH